MKTIDIIIKYINDKTSTYKILREYTPLSLSEIKSRIENHDAVITVNDLKLDELKKVREIIRSLNNIGTEVVIQDVTGTITLKILENIISSYEGIAADTERLDVFFSELKKEIVPFLKKIQEKKKTIKEVDKISVPIDEDVQLKFAKFLSSYVGFDFEKGLVETSEHPFTLNLNKNDVRLTTKNKKDSPMSTVFSIIHESGHGIYEQQTGDELIDTLLGTGGSMGLHESQSRFMENIVGENKAFWKPLYSKAGEFYPFLKDLEFEEFYKQINRIEPGLIRVEADELTYSLHIMLRYEIEKMLINGEVNIDDLPKIWNEKVKEYLGLEPKNDSEGLMQDIHWYCGLIGYFPSYAIGNAYASQIYNTMKKDFD